MKKLIPACMALVCLFSFGVAYAGDAATTFKSFCQPCHGVDGSRVPAPGVAALKGRDAGELQKALEGYKAGSYGGTQKQIMQGVVKQVPADQIQPLAEHISTL